jgi:hypothetical protein
MHAYIVLCLLVGVRTEEARALRDHRESQRQDRAAAGDLWQEHGLDFATQIGTPLDAGNVRRMFKGVCRAAVIAICAIAASRTAREGYDGHAL